MTGRKMLDPATVRADVAPKTLSTVGNYAVTVSWTDGHSSGIYSYDMLRAIGDRMSVVSEDV
jgi:ATP-binding protein involved in chromosome partitioning